MAGADVYRITFAAPFWGSKFHSSVKYHLSKMLGGKGGLPPAWITDPSVEGPAGEETRGGAVVGIFTAEQVRAVIEFFTSR